MDAPVLMHIVECKQCGATAMVRSDKTVHEVLICPCCPEQHDHAAVANACPGANGVGHDGVPCGVGVPGCTVCRPVTIKVNAAAVLTAPSVN
jgi:hypothetical protein